MKDVDSIPPSQDNKEEEQKIVPVDIYQNSIKNDELESSQRSESEDQEMFGQICKQIKITMKEILKLKTEKPDQWASELEEKKMKVLMLTLSMRKLSRIQKVRVKTERDSTSENRQNVDAATLQLQNLLYEVSHLKKEVRKCLEFQAADRQIDLVPVKQFYLEAPHNISRKEETINNPHQQRLAQLHWELEQRQGQTQLFDQLTHEKNTVSTIINDQESKLSSIKPRINAILETTRPLQKALDLPLDDEKEQQVVSQYLPSPLYTLYVQVSAYGEACDSTLKCEIKGDVEAARKLAIPPKEESDGSESEGDVELPEDARKKKSRPEKKNRDSQEREDLKHLLLVHPLHLILTIQSKDRDSVVIKFHYAQTLRIVTVFCSLHLKDHSSGIPHPLLTDILGGDKFLNLLLPGDLGLESPNPANEFHFRKLHLPTLSQEHLDVLGRPYKWAQTLAGLSFLSRESEQEIQEHQETLTDLELDETSQEIVPPVSTPEPELPQAPPKVTETLSWKMSAEHVHQIVSSIKRRLQARLSLSTQLARLETAKCTSDIPVSGEALVQHFPGKVSSELRSWKPITFQDYESNSCTSHLIKIGIISQAFLTFKAVFDRQSGPNVPSVSMEALVAISPDYPNQQPIFSLSLLWGDEAQSASSNPHIRQIESEVNVHWPELVSKRSDRFEIVSLQLYRLAMCFDILTEATSTYTTTDKMFHKEKIFFRSARGPDRSLPLKYLPKLGVFAQR